MPVFSSRPAAFACLAGLGVAGGFAAWSFHARLGEQPPAPPQWVRGGQLATQVVPGDLGGNERLLAHLATDKPLYRPGETVFGRAALLDAFTRAPAQRIVWLEWEVRSPRGDVVTQGGGASAGGIAPFSWRIPEELPGGEYRLAIKFPGEGFPPAETKFDVRDHRVPRLDTDLDFAKKAYGPGDKVTATLAVVRAEGGIPRGATATAVATVDGNEVHRSELSLGDTGTTSVSFALPATIGEGEGTLAIVVRDGGVQETAVKTIPIVLSRVKIEVFPEGGDLVSGLESRLYFEARTNKGKPASVAGRVVDASGATLATFRSEHEGRGRVTFTPPPSGVACFLAVDEPSGITEKTPLPAIAAGGFTITAVEDSGVAGEPVHVRVSATIDANARVVLACRERELTSSTVELTANKPETVTLPSTADGVLRVTLMDGKGVPRAERLVFRRPAHQVKVEVVAPERGSLRDEIRVLVRTRDETGKPVPATVVLSAVDDALLEMVERRERAPRLPVQALLGSEVRELQDCQVYLEDGPEAATKMDLLLGTQGWRRFAFVDPAAFVARSGDAAARALALHNPPPPQPAAMRFEADGGAQFEEKALAAAPRMMAPAPARGAPLQARPAGPRGQGRAAGKDVRVNMAQVARKPGRMADAKRRVARDEIEEVGVQFVREYAHHATAPLSQGRTDFAETLYWNAGLATNEQGEATVSFQLADSVTTVRFRADAVTGSGLLGMGDAEILARRPFYIEPKLPLEVTAGDIIRLPVSFVNGTRTPVDAKVELTLPSQLGTPDSRPSIALGPEQRSRLMIPLDVHDARGELAVRIAARSNVEGASDDVTRTLRVLPAGFPIELSLGGRLDDEKVHVVTIPEKVSPGSLVTEGLVYPTPLASLSQAVEALLRQPCGCFEQTSSSNYPNVMVLQYLSSHQGVDPKIVAKANALLDAGYKRLVSYECQHKGYEWFGGDPGHEALSAYGVMEFTDMAAVYPVDAGMLDRTRAWLLSKRDGKGGYVRNPRALDSFGGAPQDVTDAYITWALSQAHVSGIDAEVASVRDRATRSEDPYFLALAANVLLDVKDEAAPVVLDRLARKQDQKGVFKGAETSITRSGGESLDIETTSLAVLAFLRSPKHVEACEKAMQWILEAAKGGRFGATQSTILALKAIVAYDAAHAVPKKAGSVLLEVDGKVYDEVAFAADRQGAITLPSFSDALTPGEHRIKLKLVGGSPMPYSLSVRYHALTPASSSSCKVKLATSLASSSIKEGEAVDCRVELSNATKDGLPMVVAIVGLPGGLEARADQLKELVKQGKIDFFETKGCEVVLYRRAMAPEEKSSFVLSLVAAIPGTYTGPASRAYLYYTDEDKVWVDPLKATIE